mmetsp:Transcript_2227/g.9652  ORF Transcript_2227/g.9652 Transcript_2227/m.9652 type:complete len:239 (-) Transcript_2227:623-1339(-)
MRLESPDDQDPLLKLGHRGPRNARGVLLWRGLCADRVPQPRQLSQWSHRHAGELAHGQHAEESSAILVRVIEPVPDLLSRLIRPLPAVEALAHLLDAGPAHGHVFGKRGRVRRWLGDPENDVAVGLRTLVWPPWKIGEEGMAFEVVCSVVCCVVGSIVSCVVGSVESCVVGSVVSCVVCSIVSCVSCARQAQRERRACMFRGFSVNVAQSIRTYLGEAPLQKFEEDHCKQVSTAVGQA